MKSITIDAAKRTDPDDGVNPAVGRYLRQRRCAHGIAIERLMQMSGLRRWQIYRIEQGSRPIPRVWFEIEAAALATIEQQDGAGEGE